jgi:CRP-like cAMP-binding protein
MFTALPAQNKMRILQQIRMFQALPERALSEIERIATLGNVNKGHLFYEPETTSHFVYVLVTGRVHQYRINWDGKKIVTAMLQPQALFDTTSILADGIHHNFAEATEESLILMLHHQEFHHLLLSYPQMLIYTLAETNARLHEVEEKLESMAFRGIMGRLAELLLKLAEQQGGTRVVGYTHQDLAENVGTYRETTTQVLNELRSLGYITIKRKSIDILNARQLAATIC